MKRRVEFWAAAFPVFIISALVVWLIAPQMAPVITPADLNAAFLPGIVGACAPEGVEQARYMTAVLVPVLLMGLLILLFSELRQSGPVKGTVYRSVAAYLGLMLTVGCAGFGVYYEITHGFGAYFKVKQASELTLGLLAIYIGYRLAVPKRLKAKVTALSGRLAGQRWIPWVVAGVWTAMFVSTGLFTDDNIGNSGDVVKYHLQFTMDEFAAVLNGRIPLLDFFSQYCNLEPYLAYPLFKIFGFSVTSFSVSMCFLSFVGMMLLFHAIGAAVGSPWKSLLFYGPLTAFGSISFNNSMGRPSNVLNYYAVGPIRYIGFWIGAAAAVAYLRAPSMVRFIVVSVISGILIINNLDFGIAAGAGILFCGLLFPPPSSDARIISRIAKTTLVFFACVGAIITSYLLIVKLVAGKWPDLGYIVLFQRIFARLGFYMIPMPKVGLYWTVYLSFMSAVLIAMHTALSGGATTNRDRLLNGTLAYSGVAGLGVLTYYVGRSHVLVLSAVFFAWAFCFSLLLYREWVEWRAISRRDRLSVRIVSGLFLPLPLALMILTIPEMLQPPNPLEQYRLFKEDGARIDRKHATLVAAISKYATQGQPTVISYANGHWLAIKAGVDNRFPFNHDSSVMLKEQLTLVMRAVDELPAGNRVVFGRAASPLGKELERRGFMETERFGDFVVWSMDTTKPVSGAAQREPDGLATSTVTP